MKTKSLMIALVAFSLVACGDDDGGLDAGRIAMDGGEGNDVGSPQDTGTADPDTGTDPDAGMIATDMGTMTTDTGPIETDAGPVVDAGPPSMCTVNGNYTLTAAADNPTGCPMGTMCTATLSVGSAVMLDCGGFSADCTIDADCVCPGTAMLTMPFLISAEFTVDFTNNTATALALGLTCNYTL